jgi:hypothetical protein
MARLVPMFWLAYICPQGRSARGPCLVVQPTVEALRHEVFLPAATDGRRNGEGYSCAHPTDSHAPLKQESPYGIQTLKFIH